MQNFYSFMLCILLLVVLYGCNNGKVRELDFGDHILKGNILLTPSDTIYDGPIEYYNKKGEKVSVTNFKNNLIDGRYLKFFPNGNIQQEVNYECGMENGVSQLYDVDGKVLNKNFYYFGRALGGNYVYTKDSLLQYKFLSFDGWEIYKCKYKVGGVDTLLEYGNLINYLTQTKFVDGEKKIELFIYLVNPPHKKISYTIQRVNLDKSDTVLVANIDVDQTKQQFMVLYLDPLEINNKYVFRGKAYYPAENVTIDLNNNDIDLRLPVADKK